MKISALGITVSALAALLLVFLLGVPQIAFRQLRVAPVTPEVEEYNFHIKKFEDCPNSEVSRDRSRLTNTDPTVHKLNTDYLDLRYNKRTKLLTIETQFNNSLGNLPTGFHFALSKGPRPSGFSHLAKIYFDASEQSNIKVLGYAYNVVACHCANYLDFRSSTDATVTRLTAGSWITAYPWVIRNPDGTAQLYSGSPPPDPIFSTLNNNSSGIIVEKSSETFDLNGFTHRKFRLVLNTSDINDFVPENLNVNAPYSWEGSQFLEKLGLRFWALNAHDVQYNSEGFLSTYEMQEDCSVCGYDNVPTNASPICKSIEVDGLDADNNLRPGQTVAAKITAYDPDNDALFYGPLNLVKDAIKINYSGEPAGSIFSHQNNSIVNTDSNDEIIVNFRYTPQSSVSGKHRVNVVFTQQYGINQASVNCPLEFNVAGCEVIDWRDLINGIDDKIAHQLANNHVKKLIRNIKKLRGLNTKAEKKVSVRAGELGLEAWRTLSALQRERVIRQNCGANLAGCETIDTTRALLRVEQITVELFGMVEKLVPTYRNVLAKSGIKGKENTRRWRKILNTATNLKDSVSTSINSLPAVVFACEPR